MHGKVTAGISARTCISPDGLKEKIRRSWNDLSEDFISRLTEHI